MGIQDSLGFWILWIPGIGFQILCVRNSDSGFQSILSWIPDSLSCITIPKPKISERGYSNSFTWAYNILTSIIYFFWSSSFFFTGS